MIINENLLKGYSKGVLQRSISYLIEILSNLLIGRRLQREDK